MIICKGKDFEQVRLNTATGATYEGMFGGGVSEPEADETGAPIFKSGKYCIIFRHPAQESAVEIWDYYFSTNEKEQGAIERLEADIEWLDSIHNVNFLT
jgi:hypothetical protein